MRRWEVFAARALGLFVAVLLCGSNIGAQCTGFIFEEDTPPAVVGMTTADPGFGTHYWAWDDFNHRRSGVDHPLVVDVDGGMRLFEIDWVHASVCDSSGVVGRTAVLFEALGREGFGRWALVNLGGDRSGTVDVDQSQALLGDVSSRAAAVPRPVIEGVKIDDEVIVVELSWFLDDTGELLSDLVGGQGEPLGSVRGFAIYIINGPVATARPWDWSRAIDVQADAVNGFSTNTSATVVMPRSMWNEVVVSFGVALTFDGDGDAEGERPESRSVHGAHLGMPSPWLALPPLGTNTPVGIREFEAAVDDGRRIDIKWTSDNEPVGVFYRLWLDRQRSKSVLLERIEGGTGAYSAQIELPVWIWNRALNLRLEMVDPYGRSLDQRVLSLRGRGSEFTRYTASSPARSSGGARGRRDG